MKRELGERGQRGESSRKTRRRSEEKEEEDERSDYKVKKNLSLCSCSFRSPPESEPKELKSLLVRFNCDSTSNDILWYHINNNTNTNNANITTPTPTPTPTDTITTTATLPTTDTMVTNLTPICTVPGSSGIGRGCASALLGSKLYMFGGCPSIIDCEQRLIGCSDVFSVDFNNQFGWRKERFCMLAERCYPVAAATHGKIFIFGSNTCKTLPKPWAEVFDPNLNLFSPLPEPPLYVTQAYGSIFMTVVANGDTILLRMRDCLFSFNIVTKSWGQLSTTPLSKLGYWSPRSATLHNVLFTYSGGRVHAYDLIKEKWFKKPVLDLATVSNIPPFYLIHGFVVQTGNKTLCVVWHDEFNWRSKCSVGCVNFHVVRERNSKGKSFLRAQVHSRTDYLLPTGYCFYDCLAL